MLVHKSIPSVSLVLARYHRRILGILGLALLLDIWHNIQGLHVTRPTTPLDQPFRVGCQEPDTSAPRENATILVLARNSDVDGVVSSMRSLEMQFNRHFHYPVVFLNDQPWSQSFVSAVTDVVTGNVHFGVINASEWQYPEWIDQAKAETLMSAQDQAGVIHAGNASYHHMCRFFSGSVQICYKGCSAHPC